MLCNKGFKVFLWHNCSVSASFNAVLNEDCGQNIPKSDENTCICCAIQGVRPKGKGANYTGPL